jgi:hypothetical protein
MAGSTTSLRRLWQFADHRWRSAVPGNRVLSAALADLLLAVLDRARRLPKAPPPHRDQRVLRASRPRSQIAAWGANRVVRLARDPRPLRRRDMARRVRCAHAPRPSAAPLPALSPHQKGPQTGTARRSLRPRVLRASTKCREYSATSLSVFGGFSSVFADARRSLTNRGERFRLALQSHFLCSCGHFAVIPDPERLPRASRAIARCSSFPRWRRTSPA